MMESARESSQAHNIDIKKVEIIEIIKQSDINIPVPGFQSDMIAIFTKFFWQIIVWTYDIAVWQFNP